MYQLNNPRSFIPHANLEARLLFQGYPFFGVEPVLMSEDGKVIEGVGEGFLTFSRPWPGMMRTLFGDHNRFQEVYFSRFPGYYCTGDGN